MSEQSDGGPTLHVEGELVAAEPRYPATHQLTLEQRDLYLGLGIEIPKEAPVAAGIAVLRPRLRLFWALAE